MTSPDRPVVAGVDIGGTATRVVGWSAGRTVGDAVVSTSSLGQGEPARRVRELWHLVRSVVPAGSAVEAIGIGASGPIDPATGVILNWNTLPWFSGFDVPSLLRSVSGVPVVIENDAVAAAVGEHRVGAGKGARRMLLVTIGTGVGVAFIDGGYPYRGADGGHPEAGHIGVTAETSSCYCGTVGCWEQSASRTRLEAEIHSAGLSLSGASLVSAAAAARAGDAAAAAAFAAHGGRVGRGLAVLESVYGPTLAVIGGSVSEYLDLLLPGVEESRARAPHFVTGEPIVAVRLGPLAGAIGAAVLAEEGSASPHN